MLEYLTGFKSDFDRPMPLQQIWSMETSEVRDRQQGVSHLVRQGSFWKLVSIKPPNKARGEVTLVFELVSTMMRYDGSGCG